ncbi:MAG: LacI family transcriptional regulator [Planctomycetes bacterium]|nr:LacI family transcriptional regulator [Planctomycetota bacterium]
MRYIILTSSNSSRRTTHPAGRSSIRLGFPHYRFTIASGKQGVMKAKRTITIKDIAVRAGTSVATAGRALGGYGHVSAATRAKVVAAAKALDFQPNPSARSLKGKSTNTIGLMIANVRVPFFSMLVRAVEDAAIEKGFSVIVCNIDDDRDKEQEYLTLLRNKRVDGLIVCSAFTSRAEMPSKVAAIYECEIPTVFLDRKVEGLARPAVQTDNTTGTALAVNHLVNLGHTRIALATHLPNIDSIRNRIHGFKQALKTHGLKVEPSLIAMRGTHALQNGIDAGKALLQRRNPPTAIITINALITFGVLAAIKELGLAIPGDVALVGWDDFELADIMTPTISVIAQPTYSLGSIATTTRFGMIYLKGAGESVLLSPQLIGRVSAFGPPARRAVKRSGRDST